jgi:hypothetical protein
MNQSRSQAIREIFASPTATLTFMEKYMVAWVLFALAFGSYLFVGKISLPNAKLSLMTPLDEAIPFLAWTVWFYLGLFIVVFHLSVWSIKSRAVYARAMASLLLAWSIAYVFFIFFPSAYPRPNVAELPGVTGLMLQWLHGVDRPNNTFPSLHVADMALVALAAWQDNKKRGTLILALAALPILAILTTKQHYIADLIGGLVVAGVSHWMAFRAGVAR